jgi:hypothetical protein
MLIARDAISIPAGRDAGHNTSLSALLITLRLVDVTTAARHETPATFERSGKG